MKNKSTSLPAASLFPVLIALLLGLFGRPGTTTAQELSINLPTGYAVKINGLDPTVCQPSSAKLAAVYPSPLLYPVLITASTLSGDAGTYHLATAGKTTTLIVDIPAVGNLPGYNSSLHYAYGKLGDASFQGEGIIAPVNNPPAGYVRFQLPVTFPLGQNQSYVAFFVYDGVGNPPSPMASLFVIPYYVLGPTNPEVAILGTTVQPQLPYLVLHAPPGDGSSSEFQQGQTTCRDFEESYATDNSNSANVAVKLGIAGSLGFIATVNFEFSVTFSGGVTAGDLAIKTTSNQTCVTVNEGFSTTELSGPDGGGDVFIGYGTDLAYGVYENWTHDPGACQIRLDTGLIYTPIGLPRRFAYTKSAILSDLALLQSVVADSLTVSAKTANDAQNQIDVWNQVLALNDANVNNPSNVALTPVSFSSGVNSSQESSITVTETNSIQVEHYLEGTAGVEAVVEVGGSGVTGGYEYKSSERFGKTQNQSAETSKLVKYTLADDDGGDIFNLDVLRDPMYGTPVFRIKNGTKSSCPYQGGYQRDQPKLKHNNSTEDHLISQGNPVTQPATFLVDICNESNEARSYFLKLDASSNPNNAEVRVAGSLLNGNENGQIFLSVPANGCLENYEISVTKATQLSYPDLRIFLYPQCNAGGNDDGIESSIYASVYFGGATAVNDVEQNLSRLSVFPNPTSGVVNVGFNLLESAPVRCEVYDLLGRLQMIDTQGNFSAGANQKQLDVSALAPGVYLLEMRSGNSRISRKLVVER